MNRTSFRRFTDQVEIERGRQDAKWGPQSHPYGTDRAGDQAAANRARHLTNIRAKVGLVTWRDILNEEICEAFAESDPVLLRGELVQCAAVIAAILEDMDGREDNVNAICQAFEVTRDEIGHPARTAVTELMDRH